MSVFNKIGGVKPKLNAFNLSHSNLFDCNFGQLVPVDCIECVPGDVFNLQANVVGRLASALVSPALVDFDVVVEAFFTPTRLLMGSDANFTVPVGERNFEEFLVGGKTGDEDISLPTLSGTQFAVGGIGDYLGVQTGVDMSKIGLPLAFPWRAYRWIWNEYYRNEQLMEEIDPVQGSMALADYDTILSRCWRKDYFTSALPYQQFGTSPALPLSGLLNVSVGENQRLMLGPDSIINNNAVSVWSKKDGYENEVVGQLYLHESGNSFSLASTAGPTEDSSNKNWLRFISGDLVSPLTGTIDMSKVATFDVSDLRLAFQIQKWMERNARGGVRYTEYLNSHFGVSPRDSRLQRPEFIGSFRKPWYISEVLQTSASSTDSAQGNQAGQAICLVSGDIGKYRCYEFGYILILASVLPKASYQQGVPRWMNRKTRYDFYSPEFAHLSEQAILNKELYVSGNKDTDESIFGFTGVFNELRYLPSRVSNHMRSGASPSFDYWHYARSFSATPVLNKDFLGIGTTSNNMSELNRIFAVQDENPFIMHVGLNIKALRPLPYIAEPGLLDHF